MLSLLHEAGVILMREMTGTDDALFEVLALLWAGNKREESFEFLCSNCHHRVELPTRQVTPDGVGWCPRCGAPAEIRWRET